MVFRPALSCLTGDCSQLWFCLSTSSKNMHNSQAPEGPGGESGPQGSPRDAKDLEYRKREQYRAALCTGGGGRFVRFSSFSHDIHFL